MSHRDVVAWLADGFGVSMGLGSVASCERATSLALYEPVTEAHTALQTGQRADVDETGWRQRTQRAWLWVGVG